MSDDRIFTAYPEFTITQAQRESLAQTRDGLVVTRTLANRYGWKAGDMIPMIAGNVPRADGSKLWTFDILAIIDNVDFPDAQFGIGNYTYLDEGRASDKGTVNGFVLRIRDAAQATEISEAIDALFANSAAQTRTRSERAGAEAYQNSGFNIGFFIKAVVGSAFFTLLVLTANTMAQSFRERIPEFAVLKTLGFSDDAVLALVLAEAVSICVVAALVGLAVAEMLIPLAKPIVGGLAHMPPVVILSGIAASLLVALVSGGLPAWRARRLVVVDALAER
jgi:putative ABC transport system permease protein